VLISAEVGAKNFRSEKIISACTGSLNWSNIIKLITSFETNLGKNISPSAKELMGFISFEGTVFLFGGA